MPVGVGGTSDAVILDAVVRVGDNAGTRELLPVLVLALGAREIAPPAECDVFMVRPLGGGVVGGAVALRGDRGSSKSRAGEGMGIGIAVGGAEREVEKAKAVPAIAMGLGFDLAGDLLGVD